MKEKISEIVIEKINGENIKMRPCGYFKTRSGIWLLSAGTLFLLTTLAVSLGLYYIESYKPAYMLVYRPIMFFFALPYLFIALSILLLFLSARCYRKSRNMCRHEEWLLFTVLVSGSLLIGSAIFSANLDWQLRKQLEENQVYKKMVMTPKYFWTSPQNGTLSGVVIRKVEEDAVILKSWNGTSWNVLVLNKEDIHSGKTEPRTVVKMIGTQGENRHFVAQKIWHWN